MTPGLREHISSLSTDLEKCNAALKSETQKLSIERSNTEEEARIRIGLENDLKEISKKHEDLNADVESYKSSLSKALVALELSNDKNDKLMNDTELLKDQLSVESDLHR